MFEIFLKRFEALIVEDRINSQHRHEEELIVLYFEITKLVIKDYESYRRYFPAFLSVLEKHDEECLKYAVQNFEDLHREVFNQLSFFPFDLSLMKHLTDVPLVNRCYHQMRLTLEKGQLVRISDNPFNFTMFSKDEKGKIAGALINVLQEKVREINWTNQDFETIHMLLLPVHQLLKDIGNEEMFFYTAGLVTDKLCAADDFQSARNIAEEFIKTAYDDGLPDLGFWNLFRIYSVTKNANGGLLCGCMAFLLILENRRQLSDRQGIDIIWQTVKFFRNIEFYPWAQKFYENKPAGLVFPEYNRRALDHTYFYCLLKSRNTATPEILLNYLRAESENLLKGGLQEASPWLVLLTQVKGLFPKADFSENGLGFYYNAFKSIVPAGSLKKQLDVINADSEDIIGYLKEAIVKLEKVIGQDDFVYDNNPALLLSNRTMVYSFRHKNVTGFLLSMRIKADFSILFEPKYVGDLVPFVLQEADVSGLDAIYNIPVTWLSPLTEPKEATLIWLGIVEGKLFQLTFFQQKFLFTEPPKWSFKKFSIKRNSKYFSKLKFDTSKKVRGQVRSIDPDEHFAIEAEMARQLEFGRISTPVNAQFVFVVKDIILAPFPHNLLLDINGEFIAKTIPVTNVISAEWLKSRDEVFLSTNYSKAIWIPTESNDDTLPYLYSHLEDEITTRHFEISQLIDPPKPLSADLNIICAHGAKDIAELQVLFHGNEISFNMNKIVGKGKLLIMFVCHSGSAKNQLFKNESVSLISRFIQQGYEAVVAPAWALDITVVRIWLPVFLSSIDEGDTIDQAVFKANVAVFNQIPNPAAWACLHLYGNPGLKIQ